MINSAYVEGSGVKYGSSPNLCRLMEKNYLIWSDICGVKFMVSAESLLLCAWCDSFYCIKYLFNAILCWKVMDSSAWSIIRCSPLVCLNLIYQHIPPHTAGKNYKKRPIAVWYDRACSVHRVWKRCLLWYYWKSLSRCAPVQRLSQTHQRILIQAILPSSTNEKHKWWGWESPRSDTTVKPQSSAL